jgi:hypothetical protein
MNLARAFQCDRCERLFPGESALNCTTKAGLWGELCRECLDWLNKEVKNHK